VLLIFFSEEARVKVPESGDEKIVSKKIGALPNSAANAILDSV
jgi:hypothetical protein